jgi:hypothetical protein
MKKKSVPITLVGTLIVIVLGIWAYYEFVRPIYLNNVNQSETIKLKNDTDFAFGKHSDHGKVYGIELEMSGNSASNFDLIISNGTEDVHMAIVKGKNIEFIYKNDWYSDSVFLELIPKKEIGGKVTVECRFLALD